MRNTIMTRATILAMTTLAAALLLSACGSEPAAAPQPTPTAAPPPTPAATAATAAPAPDTEWDAILGTTLLRPGSQRVALLLTSATALVTVPEVTISTYAVDEAGAVDGPKQSATASFRRWPYGTRGSYATELSFDTLGTWRLEITGPGDGGSTNQAVLDVEVTGGYQTLDVGARAPASVNRTLATASGLEELTSAYEPDPALYQTSIADALGSGMPTVVVFATPAFCTSATCGPQVETVSEVRRKFDGRASFIHVEVYDNPQEVQGDLSRGVTSPVVEEWGLTSDPHWTNESWVFVINAQGTVTHRFEAYTTAEELEEALAEVVG